jgi:hypothetical protein
VVSDPRVARVRKMSVVFVSTLTVLVAVIAWFSTHNVILVLAAAFLT